MEVAQCNRCLRSSSKLPLPSPPPPPPPPSAPRRETSPPHDEEEEEEEEEVGMKRVRTTLKSTRLAVGGVGGWVGGWVGVGVGGWVGGSKKDETDRRIVGWERGWTWVGGRKKRRTPPRQPSEKETAPAPC